MDETALAAELLAEKFSSGAHSSSQAQHAHLQEPLNGQLQSPAHVQEQMDQPSQSVSTTTYMHTSNGVAASGEVATTYPQATGTTAVAGTGGETSSEPVQAYAKLEGDSFCYYIRTLQVTFGRKASSSDHVDIHLGPTKAISRQHARLFYNFTTQRFEMMVFGKNGAFVNDQFVEKGVTVPLENRTKIQIGEVSFSFLLPKIESDEPAQEASSGQGTSQRGSGSTGGASSSGNSYRGAGLSAANNPVKREDSTQPPEVFDSSEYSSRDTKPPFSYASLIAQAINSTSSRKLTLNGIYQHITQHYPYYQMTQNGWQNSIRHNLSLNKAFVKVPRSDSEPGKGAFWTIDQSCEAQFSNGVYKRSRRAMSSKPPGARSESPFDASEKPRKRLNTGADIASTPTQTVQLQSSQSTIKPIQPTTVSAAASPSTSRSPVTAAAAAPPDYSQISEASLKLAALLQQNPGMLAMNLATLTQSLAAANKEGAQNAVLTALLAAAKANQATAAGAARSGVTPAGSSTTSATQTTTVSPAAASSITQSLATLQAVAQAIAAARNAAAANASANANSNSNANTTSPAGTSTVATSAVTTPAVPSTIGTSFTSASIASASLSAAAVSSSPIAQLVAAAQAQAAAAQARALAQAQSQAPSPVPSPTITTTTSLTTTAAASVSASVSVPVSAPVASVPQASADAQAQVLALQARALAQAQAQAQRAQEEKDKEAQVRATSSAVPSISSPPSSLLSTAESTAAIPVIVPGTSPVPVVTPVPTVSAVTAAVTVEPTISADPANAAAAAPVTTTSNTTADAVSEEVAATTTSNTAESATTPASTGSSVAPPAPDSTIESV
ncbi:Pre-rRNA-processing protein fhl1 [Mortierella claussenii]|nr:Pre-rRNA-processing protein fhl1 [Mortierella claussenii]